jgi:hypothetical protein
MNVFAAVFGVVVFVALGAYCWRGMWDAVRLVILQLESMTKQGTAPEKARWHRKEARFHRLMTYLMFGGTGLGMVGASFFFIAFVKALATLLP